MARREGPRDLGSEERLKEPTAFHREALLPHQLEVLRAIAPPLASEGFYLAGGTALAIQLGHRTSVDFDWFRDAEVSGGEGLVQRFETAGVTWEVRQVSPGTVHGTVRGVATSLFSYRYALLSPPVLWKDLACPLASIDDIACMKLVALAQRGARKDFVDIYAILESSKRLPNLLEQFRTKYRTLDIGHVLVALNYFDDAEAEPMPTMIWKANWSTMKTAIRSWVKDYAG